MPVDRRLLVPEQVLDHDPRAVALAEAQRRTRDRAIDAEAGTAARGRRSGLMGNLQRVLDGRGCALLDLRRVLGVGRRKADEESADQASDCRPIRGRSTDGSSGRGRGVNPADNNEGKTPALSDEPAKKLLQAPAGDVLRARRDRAVLPVPCVAVLGARRAAGWEHRGASWCPPLRMARIAALRRPPIAFVRISLWARNAAIHVREQGRPLVLEALQRGEREVEDAPGTQQLHQEADRDARRQRRDEPPRDVRAGTGRPKKRQADRSCRSRRSSSSAGCASPRPRGSPTIRSASLRMRPSAFRRSNSCRGRAASPARLGVDAEQRDDADPDREAHVVVERPQEPERADQREGHREQDHGHAEPRTAARYSSSTISDEVIGITSIQPLVGAPGTRTCPTRPRVAGRQRHLRLDDARPRRRSRRGRGRRGRRRPTPCAARSRCGSSAARA
jgi:hypothetical protein